MFLQLHVCAEADELTRSGAYVSRSEERRENGADGGEAVARTKCFERRPELLGRFHETAEPRCTRRVPRLLLFGHN
jgi:hypothetical protein